MHVRESENRNADWLKSGRAFGLKGHFEDVPAYQIINDVTAQTLTLVSEVASIKYQRPPLPAALVAEAEGLRRRYRQRKRELRGPVRDVVLASAELYNEIAADRQRLKERLAAALLVA